ncbi:tetracycline efflux MFS transporter Tet(V) [Mycobacterium sp. shizuoka-1]|uniref:tetracycline efflux MFS transporter Tet(V) n=1 Tax=Mycobacterium sp. shizuoka-1 TaxID=2039281 RepID=UPI000C065009|nr:tetracycline efflux MFS transporter Tet(V) [Mycobacterium sp. shizuoka-1]GAY17702.1 tetracycline efflux MFS transporter Tet(V) [Mycobacterium sp. shizuoka-1]
MSTPCDTDEPVRTTGRWRVLAPFGYREFRLLIAAMSLFLFAEGMWTVVMALQVIALADDPAALSLVAACLAGGMLAFILIGGIVADRASQRAVIIAVEAANVVATGAVAVLGLTDHLRLWHMAVAATVLGIGAAFFFPAYNAYLPRILPAEHLLAANGVEGAIRPTLQQAIGPATAGVLIGLTFPALGTVTVTALMAAGLILLVAMRPGDGSHIVMTVERQTPHVLTDLRDGLRFVVRTPWLRWTLLFACSWVFLALGPIEVLLPFIARDRFAHGEQVYGVLLAAFGLGSALGALAVSSRQLPRRYLTVMMVMWGAGSLPLAIVGTTTSLPVMAIALFVVGVTDGAGMVIWGTLLQRRVPPAMLGRVSSLDFFVSLAFMPVSMAVAGPLSKVVSVELIFAVTGIAPVLLAAVALTAARMPRDEIAHPLR